MNARLRTRLVLTLFVCSGAAGLCFETALQRELHRIFGVSAWATATVLAAFMAGTALGAWVLGRFADRATQPLRLYAILETGVAISAALTPRGALFLRDLYLRLATGIDGDSAWLFLLRFALAFVFALVPTFLMGGTLPMTSRAYKQLAVTDAGQWVSRLYLWNLAGAALGALATAYLALPLLGLSSTLVAGAGFNALAALLALLASQGLPGLEREPAGAPPARAHALLLLAAAWSGFSALALEVVWTHLLGIAVGNSVYAFGLMLAIFLAGLMIGSLYSARVSASRLTWVHLGKVQLAISILLLLSIPIWAEIPEVFGRLGDVLRWFWPREGARALACVVVIGIPACVAGAFYPLLLRQAGNESGGVGHAVGGITAANTLGAVAGSLVAGFVLLPALGARQLLQFLLVLGAIAAAICFRGKPRFQLAALGVAALSLLLPAWNLSEMANGQNVYFSVPGWAHGEVLFAAESVESGLTTVTESPPHSHQLVLLTNGKFQGNNTGEAEAQYRFGQVPMLVQRKTGRALVIGVGTGATSGVVAAEAFQSVEIVELSHDIVAAARLHFADLNANVFDSPKVSTLFADGRNHLLTTATTYDLITVEVSSIWIAGEADLYNREFYTLAKKRLAPDGILQQWVQLHHMSRKDLAVILASVRAEFPHMLFLSGGGQGQILASQSPLQVDPEHLVALSNQLRGTPAMRGIPAGDLLMLLGELRMDEKGIGDYIAAVASSAGVTPEQLISTDDNLLLEYDTPRNNAGGDRAPSVQAVASTSADALALMTTKKPGLAEHLAAVKALAARDFASGVKSLNEAIARGDQSAIPLRDQAEKALRDQQKH